MCVVHCSKILLPLTVVEKVVVNVNSTKPRVLEETITFGSQGDKSSSSSGSSDWKVINIKFSSRKRGKQNPSVLTTVQKLKKKSRKHHHHRLRRKCCTAGELMAKHGMSCLIPRFFRFQFFNLVTSTRQKYQSTSSDTFRGRFRSKRTKRIFRETNHCVKRSKKGIVQKCCFAYKVKMRNRWGN